MRSLRVVLLLVVAGFRRQSAYPLATLAGLVANLTFGLLKTAILLAAIHSAGGTLAGYTVGTMSAYVWLSQGLLGSVNMGGRTDLMARVRTGDVAVDFLRPFDVQAASIAADTGASLFSLVPRGVPSVAVGALVVGMTMPAAVSPYLLGAVSLVVAVVISHAIVYCVAVTGFWLVETRGVVSLYMAVAGLLAGLYVPVHLLPGWLQTVAHGTPFPSMMQTPIDVLTARVAGPDAVAALGVQVAWLAAMLAAGQLLTRAGRRMLEVQGG